MTHDVHDDRSTGSTTRSHDAALIARMILIAAIVVALVLVALDNRTDATVGYVFGEKKGPIWLVMLCSAVAGAVIGWLIKHRPHRR